MKLNTHWIYRLAPKVTEFGVDLLVYSERKGDFVHLAYLKPSNVVIAEARYRETTRYLDLHPTHLHFSINNLMEMKALNDDLPIKEVTDMIDEVCGLLGITGIDIDYIDIGPTTDNLNGGG